MVVRYTHCSAISPPTDYVMEIVSTCLHFNSIDFHKMDVSYSLNQL